MSFKRGNTFRDFRDYKVDQESAELEEIGENQKHFQYFGFQQKSRAPGLQRQSQVMMRGGSRDGRDDIPSNNNNGARLINQRVKPGKEIYRPPTGGSWNIDAQEFKPLSPAPLTSSRSVDSMRSGLSITVKPGARHISSSDNTADMEADKLIEVFGVEMEEIIKQLLEDPNRVSARSHMELVRQIFSRVVELQKISELAAQFCIYIIERETRETFLESLLNTCQEWYHERERMIRSENKSGRWAAFMAFLNELYALLKRKQVQLQSKYEGVAPKLVLLTLLAECCIVTLTQSSVLSLAETEVLFQVLTHLQRDLISEAPGQMSLIVNCLREAFLTSEAPPQARKTLLQLLELQSAGWQLPAEAVMYYYPGAKLS